MKTVRIGGGSAFFIDSAMAVPQLLKAGVDYIILDYLAEGAMGLRDAVAPPADQVENTRALGLIIYDKYILLFQLSGLILLVAMIGAILLTMRHRKDVKRQNVLHQMWRDPAKAMELKDVKPGQGL